MFAAPGVLDEIETAVDRLNDGVVGELDPRQVLAATSQENGQPYCNPHNGRKGDSDPITDVVDDP